jgi:hypothetical protein
MAIQFEVFHPRTLSKKHHHFTNSHPIRSPFCGEKSQHREESPGSVSDSTPIRRDTDKTGISFSEHSCKPAALGGPFESGAKEAGSFTILILSDTLRITGCSQRFVGPILSKQAVEGHGPSTSKIQKGRLPEGQHIEPQGRNWEVLYTDYKHNQLSEHRRRCGSSEELNVWRHQS